MPMVKEQEGMASRLPRTDVSKSSPHHETKEPRSMCERPIIDAHRHTYGTTTRAGTGGWDKRRTP